ncbi:DUF4158 domain-containing protein [Streptomyces sp. NPDC053048]|uniref:DUF4158 domain-containing protein n=1 Tax=Streptomyces sp. NPDC053048 TaxID=3365694 RepID=UPI0037D920FD
MPARFDPPRLRQRDENAQADGRRVCVLRSGQRWQRVHRVASPWDDAVAVHPDCAPAGTGGSRAHHVSPRRARPGDHDGHWIHHHHQRATDYWFTEPPSFIVIGTDEGPARTLLRRTHGHRLYMAVQICTARYIGRFLGENPLAVPWEAVEYPAGQLGIADASCVRWYGDRRSTVYEHTNEVKERFRYRNCSAHQWGRQFRRFLYRRAWTHAEAPVTLFNQAVTWLRRDRVLPGFSVLARQVSEARTAAERRLYQAAASAAYLTARPTWPRSECGSVNGPPPSPLVADEQAESTAGLND